MADNFWLSAKQWVVIAPHLPMVHTRPERQDEVAQHHYFNAGPFCDAENVAAIEDGSDWGTRIRTSIRGLKSPNRIACFQ
jgi:hypothetical protein